MIAALYVETNGLAARLAKRLRKNDETGCLIWTGYRNAKGYGSIAITPGNPGFTHRVAWEVENGKIPSGLCVLHRCDTPACCNVNHLFLGTKADNNAYWRPTGRPRQGVTQARQTHCKHGHPFSEDNTRVYAGKRVCRTCARDWMRAKRAAE
jgi:hypothetical protein